MSPERRRDLRFRREEEVAEVVVEDLGVGGVLGLLEEWVMGLREEEKGLNLKLNLRMEGVREWGFVVGKREERDVMVVVLGGVVDAVALKVVVITISVLLFSSLFTLQQRDSLTVK